MIKLYKGNCLKVLPKISSGSIDLTVTSPPYDKLRSYNDGDKLWNDNVWKMVLIELYRVTKKGGVVVWVVGDAVVKGSETGTSFRQALFAVGCGFSLYDTMIYYTNKLPTNGRRYNQTFEYMFIFSIGKIDTFNPIREPCEHPGVLNKGGQRLVDGEKKPRTTINRTGATKVKGNIWYLPRSSKSGDIYSRDHPSTYPYELANDHIITWSNECDTILDPFMGSGTTGLVCKNLNRNFIGIELDKNYFRLAKKRIR